MKDTADLIIMFPNNKYVDIHYGNKKQKRNANNRQKT